jgi:amino acid adenylation domain-containing protein/non-ribosomal peptide synthase protein (TIGR01720 family)
MTTNPELSSKNVQNIYRLSPMQEGIYFHAMKDGGSDAYFCQNAYRVNMPLQNGLLEKSLQLLVERHDALRTVFSHQKTEHCIQVVLKKRVTGIFFEDVSNLNGKLQQHLQDFKTADRKKSFDLAKDMLLRLAVFRIAKDQYELVWSHHHIIMDGWCASMLMQEFTGIYHSLEQSLVPAATSAAQFGSYINWLQLQNAGRSEDFWRNYLQGFVQSTGLPPRGGIKAAQPVFDELELTLPAALCSRLEQLATSLKITSNTIYQCAWALVLAHLNNTTDVAFGAVVSARPAEIKGIDQMIGLFINTLPVRMQIDRENTLQRMLLESQQNALAAVQHQHYPLHLIQSTSAVREQLIDHVFIMENFGSAFNNTADAENYISVSGSFSQTNYNLNIVVVPGRQTSVRFNYNTTVYHADQVAAVSRMFDAIIEQIVQHPEMKMADLQLTPAAEVENLLKMGAGPKQDWRGTICGMFAQQAFIHASRVAVVTEEGEKITYAQLHKKARNLSMILHAAGCAPGKAIGVHTGNTVHTIVSIMAIFRAGGTYVPLDTQLPEARLLHIIKDAGIDMVLVLAGKQELLAGFDGSVIQADTDYDCAWMEDISAYPNPNDTAYIIYTSGTTGLPKGVPIRHQSIADRIAYHNDYLNITPGDKILQFAAVSFDASLVEIFMALTTGAACVLISKECKANVEMLKETMLAEGVTTAIFPPAYLKLLGANELRSLQKIISTGEAAILPDMLAHAKYRMVVNGYGPTETCVGASFHQVNTEDADTYKITGALPIGKPFSNTNVYVLEANRKLLPQGCTGEICIAGRGLSKGYINRDELTAEKFISNPFSNDEGYDVLYRTGDLGYWNVQGELEYEGRIDQQVQVRGIRIEPGEIEKLLLLHAGVEESFVMQANCGGELRLLAYLRVAQDHEVSEASLRSFLQERIPAFMIPWRFMQLDSFPLSSNGKIDRKALPLPDAEEKATVLIKPVNKAGEDLIAALCSVMRKESISMDAHFLELGGDSIKAIQLVSRLYRQGWKLELKDVFSYPVLHDMAAHIQLLSEPADQRAVEGEVPLGPIQAEFFERRFHYPNQFNQSVLLQYDGRLHKDVIQNIFEKITTHHDALRMVYLQQAGELKQFNKGIDAVAEVHEINVNNANELAAHAEQLQQSFDLAKGPLLKAAIYHLPANDRLLLVAHHLVVDGVSWRILLEDISTLYEQSLKGQSLSLPPKTDSFSAWAQQLNAYQLPEQERNYWLNNDVNAAALLPLKATGLPEAMQRAGFALNAMQTQQLLTGTSHAYRTEVNDVLLASVSIAFAKVFETDKTWIALEGHGRQSAVKTDVSRTVGWFTSVYPVQLDAAAKNDTGLHIRSIKEQLRKVPGKGAGYAILKYIIKDPVGAHEPQVLFNYLGQFDGETGNAGFTPAQEHAGNNVHPNEKILYPIVITAMVLDNKLQLNLRYNAGLLQAGVAQQISSALQQALLQCIDHCYSRTHTQITPSDLVWPGIGMEQLEAINKKYQSVCSAGIADIYPLSPMQEGMLFHELLDNSTGAYIYQVSYRIKGKVDAAAVAQTADLLVKRHDILRTVFHFKETEYLLQAVLAETSAQFSYQELDDEQQLHHLLQQDKNKRFNLEKGPLFRLALAKLSEDEHVFIWTCHHILMDGWCMGILIAEFRELYVSIVSHNAHRLPQPAPFREYIQWLVNADRNKALEYWSNYLNGYDPNIALQHHQTESTTDYRAGLHVRTLTAAQTKQLKELCYQSGSTMFDCMQAIWGILLCKYNHTRDAVFGCIVSGRPPVVPGIERMLGLFINMIPVRVSYNDDTLFASLLTEIRKLAAEAEQYHFCPLAQVQARTSLKDRELDHFIQLENYPVDQAIAKEAGEMDWKISEVSGHEHTHYNFTLTIGDGEQASFSYHYNSNVYSQETVSRIAEHFNYLLLQVLENRWISVELLKLNTPAQLQELESWSRGAHRDYPVEKGFIHLFAEQVKKNAKNIAVRDSATTWTYAQLYHEASSIAAALKNEHNLLREEVVGTCMERSVWMQAAVLGIWMAGGAYLPLDPQLPPERIRFMMQDANVRICLKQNNLPQQTPTVQNVPVELQANSLSYVIYTSGSTGKPKGVMIEQGGMLNHMFSKIEDLNIDKNSIVAQTAAIGFDISVWQLLSSLLAGAQVRVFAHAEVLEPAKMFDHIRNEKITHWQVSPVYLSEVLGLIELSGSIPSLPSLKYMIATGEALRPGLVKRWFDVFPDIPLVNAYGPTEASDDITHAIITAPPANGRVPLGKALNNLQVYVKDASGDLCAAGIPGEIYVSGIGVGRGYTGNITKDNFVESTGDQPRMYRTGDWGAWIDGQLYFIGRKDGQVKINGHRIETGEIENTLSAAPGIAEAAVIIGTQNEQPALIAYIQWKPGHAANKDELKNWLRQRLTDYMIPSAFVELEKFPVTVNGKMDRAALPRIAQQAPKGAQQIPASLNEKEQALAIVWQQVLGVGDVSINDDFFENGGDSIRCIQMTSRLYSRGYKLEVQDIFDYPIMRQMAERLRPLEDEPEPIDEDDDEITDEISAEDASMISNLFN